MAERDLKGKVLKLRYGLTTRVSERGAGGVYLGWDEDKGKQVLVRVPHEDLLDDDDFVERFLAPGHVPEDVPGLAAVLEIDRDGELPYAIVEYVEGETVRERMKSLDGRLAAEDVLPWVHAVGRTLSELHGRGVSHRGVSPRSIVLTPEGDAILTDVAVASALDEAPSAPEVLDPRVYAAPEATSTRITPESDQFSLAATVATAVMGDGFLARQSRKGLVGALTTRMPVAAAEAIHRALDPEPGARWPDVERFAAAFADAVEAERSGGGLGEGTSTMMLTDISAEVAHLVEPVTGEIEEDVPLAEAIPLEDEYEEEEPAEPAEPAVVVAESPREPAPAPRLRWGLLVGGLVAVALVAGIWFVADREKRGAVEPSEPPTPVAEKPAEEPVSEPPGEEPGTEPEVVPEKPPVEEPPPFSAKLTMDPAQIPAVTKSEALEVTGRLEDGAGGWVDVDGRRFDPDATGTVILTLPLHEGQNEFTVRFFDRHERAGPEQMLVVERDTKPPSVTVTSKLVSPTAATRVVVKGRMLDDHPKEVRVGEVVVAVGEDRTFEAEVELKEEGKNTFSVVGVDEVGLESPERKLAVVRDTAGPIVTIDAPAGDEPITAESIEVRGTASDPHLEAVTVNGTAASVAPNGFFSCHVKLTEGATEIVVVATDSLDHETKETRVVRRDTTGPGLTITEPAKVHATAEETVTVKGRVQDPNPGPVSVDGIEVTPDESGWFEAVVALKPGENRIRVVATDAAGNPSKEEILLVTLDRTGPEIDPGDVPAETEAEKISISGTVSEDGCTVTVGGEDAVLAGRRFTAEVALSVGKNTIEIEARDKVGNPSSRTLEVQRRMPGPPPGAALLKALGDSGSVNGETPPGFPVGLSAGDVVAGPATIETPEKDLLEVANGAAVLVQKKDRGVHVFFVRSGMVTGTIGATTSVGIPQGWLVVPRGTKTGFKAVTTSKTESRMRITDGSGALLSGKHSVILGPNQLVRLFGDQPGVFRYLSPVGNATPITIRAELAAGLAAFVRVPGGIGGRIESMSGGKRVRFSFTNKAPTGKRPFVWTKLGDRKIDESSIDEGQVAYVNRGRNPGKLTVEDAD